MKSLNKILIAFLSALLILSPSFIQAGEQPTRIVETTPKRVLVLGSFLYGRNQFMMDSAITIKSKGDLRIVHYLVPEGSPDIQFLESHGVKTIQIPKYSQQIVDD